MDNRVQEVSVDLSAFSSDIQEVATSVTVGYRINQANAMTIYKEVGRKYEDVLILPRVPEVVKAVVAHYDASSLISNRDAVAEQMDAQLRSVWHSTTSTSLTSASRISISRIPLRMPLKQR